MRIYCTLPGDRLARRELTDSFMSDYGNQEPTSWRYWSALMCGKCIYEGKIEVFGDEQNKMFTGQGLYKIYKK